MKGYKEYINEGNKDTNTTIIKDTEKIFGGLFQDSNIEGNFVTLFIDEVVEYENLQKLLKLKYVSSIDSILPEAPGKISVNLYLK